MITTWPSDIRTTIDTVHKRIHEGRYFTGGYYNAALANNGVIELLLQSSSTHITHVLLSGEANGDATVQFFEGTTVSNVGTAVTMSNHNRTSAKTFSGTFTHTPTITADGTQVNGTGFLAAGSKGVGAVDFNGFGNEFDLTTSTNYLLRITNVSGGAIKIAIHASCYQPTL